jgi:NAD-dependent deacetylase
MDIPRDLLDAVRKADRITVLTGAGISAESGVPTFRDKLTGLWEQYNPEDLTSIEGFQRNPTLVWNWHEWLADKMASAAPNAGHRALADWAQRRPGLTLITQNIDGLHQRAGSRGVIELHGNIHRLVCSREKSPAGERRPFTEIPPRCPSCGAYLRHDVVWFGEALPSQAIEAAAEAARGCRVFLAVGTSGVVQPAASLPWLALETGALVVEINPQDTPLSRSAGFRLRGPAGEVLPRLV